MSRTEPTPSDTAAAELLRCEVDMDGDVAVVRPVGALDMATVPTLRRELADLRGRGFKHLTLDLRKLEFMDSTGLRLMLELDAEARQDGFTFALAPGGRTVQRVFELTGTAGLLPFIDA